MRHRVETKTLGRKPSARKDLMRDLATSLIVHEKMKTTLTKAKLVRPIVERLVTRSKKNDLATRRYLLKYFATEQPANKLLEVLGPRYAKRAGGYTRITKLGTRQGDAASVAIIEFISYGKEE